MFSFFISRLTISLFIQYKDDGQACHKYGCKFITSILHAVDEHVDSESLNITTRPEIVCF